METLTFLVAGPLWGKTEGFETPCDVNITAMTPDGTVVSHTCLQLPFLDIGLWNSLSQSRVAGVAHVYWASRTNRRSLARDCYRLYSWINLGPVWFHTYIGDNGRHWANAHMYRPLANVIMVVANLLTSHDDVIKWKNFPRYWPFVRGIHRSPVNSPHKGQWRGALMFSLNRAWLNGWVNNREAGDLRRYRAHYDVIVMKQAHGRYQPPRPRPPRPLSHYATNVWHFMYSATPI